MSARSLPRRSSAFRLLGLIVFGACTTGQGTASTALLDGVPVYQADAPCVNGRPEETREPYPANDVYVDSQVVAWPADKPEEVGLDSALLGRGVEEVGRAPTVLSLLVARHGRLVVEEYFNGAQPSYGRNIHSATKSLLALLVGAAIDDGILPGIDIPIGDLLPEAADSQLAAVSVEQLLSMSGGLDHEVEGEPASVGATIRLPLVFEPGTQFRYNTAESELVALALDRLAENGMCLYAHDRLLGPLGITVDHWHVNPEGNVTGGSAAFMTPRELALIGQLVLNDGVWDGRQLVSSEWLQTMLNPRFDLARRPGGGPIGYALHWWIYEIGGQPVWTAWGHGSQFLHVFPELDMVVVLTHDTAFDDTMDRARLRQVSSIDLARLFILPAVVDAEVEVCCPSSLVRVHPDGSDRQVLTTSLGFNGPGDWSPDGSRIAFHSFRDLNGELYVVNADGTDLQRLTYDFAADALPHWSPDGSRIAFLSDRDTLSVDGLLALDLYLIDPVTREVEPLTEGFGDVRGLDWSPDGNRIAFTRGDTPDGLGDLWTIDLGTGTTELLLEGRFGFPSWSPDGSRIVMTMGIEDEVRIGVLDLASGELADLGPGDIPTWLPDGRRVVATDTADQPPVLVAIDLETGERTMIGPYPFGSISPDGQWGVFGEGG